MRIHFTCPFDGERYAIILQLGKMQTRPALQASMFTIINGVDANPQHPRVRIVLFFQPILQLAPRFCLKPSSLEKTADLNKEGWWVGQTQGLAVSFTMFHPSATDNYRSLIFHGGNSTCARFCQIWALFTPSTFQKMVDWWLWVVMHVPKILTYIEAPSARHFVALRTCHFQGVSDCPAGVSLSAGLQHGLPSSRLRISRSGTTGRVPREHQLHAKQSAANLREGQEKETRRRRGELRWVCFELTRVDVTLKKSLWHVMQPMISTC